MELKYIKLFENFIIKEGFDYDKAGFGGSGFLQNKTLELTFSDNSVITLKNSKFQNGVLLTGNFVKDSSKLTNKVMKKLGKLNLILDNIEVNVSFNERFNYKSSVKSAYVQGNKMDSVAILPENVQVTGLKINDKQVEPEQK